MHIFATSFVPGTATDPTAGARPCCRGLAAGLMLLLAAACGDDAGDGSGSGGGGATSAQTSGSGASCPTLSEGPGGEACGDEVCLAGQYCEGVVCLEGCETANTCAAGEYCDLSGADEVSAGTCRPPPSACTDGTGSGSPAPADCEDRCAAKLFACDFADEVDGSFCSQACAVLSEDTLECLEAASCAALADGEECGVPFGN